MGLTDTCVHGGLAAEAGVSELGLYELDVACVAEIGGYIGARGRIDVTWVVSTWTWQHA